MTTTFLSAPHSVAFVATCLAFLALFFFVSVVLFVFSLLSFFCTFDDDSLGFGGGRET